MDRNEQQKAAIFSQKSFIAVSAGAGSGKTSVLTERYCYILEENLHSSSFGANVKEIVALTFTEKAAREMRNRIRQQIERKVETTSGEVVQFWMTQLQDFEQATISTFHSFCMNLLKDYSFEADVYPDFSLMDELQAGQLKNQVITELLADPDHQEKWQSIYQYYSRSYIKGLVLSIYGKMKEYETPIHQLLMGSDLLDQSVLEREITNLEANMVEKIERFIVLAKAYQSEFPHPETITRASAVRARLEELGVFLDSEASLKPIDCFQWISKFNVPNTAERHAPTLYQFYQDELLPCKQEINYLYKQITVLQKKRLTVDQIRVIRAILTAFSDVLQTFDRAYTREKRALNVMDFSDLQQKAISLLDHEHIREICRNQYKHFLLDEFQDTNPLQMSLLERIVPHYQFIVGDGKQSIYRFRGADVGLIKRISELAKANHDNGQYINLFINYRTCSSIIDFVNITFEQLLKVDAAEEKLPYKIQYERLQSNRNGLKEKENRVELFEGADKDAEMQFIANRIVEMKNTHQEIFDKDTKAWRSVDWHDIAILIPNRTNLLILERELQSKNIPYTVYGGLGFYDQPEVRDAIMLLQWLNRPFEELYIFALLKSPLIGLTLDDLVNIKKVSDGDVSTFIYEEEFIEHPLLSESSKRALNKVCLWFQHFVPFIPSGSIKESLRVLFQQSSLETICLLQKNNVQRVRNLEKLINILEGFHSCSLEIMLNRLAFVKDFSEKEGNAEVELINENSLHIMTVHASKGLEFPVVFVTNTNGSLRPDSGDVRFDETTGLVAKCKVEDEDDPLRNPAEIIPFSFTEADVLSKEQGEEEWKRLFYVAVTRARDYLILTGHGKGKGSWLEQLKIVMENDERLLNKIKLIEGYQEVESVIQEQKEYKLPIYHEREQIPRSFSVTEVMSYLHDPSSYYMKHVLKLDLNLVDEREYDEWSQEYETAKYNAAVLGTLVHRACELLDHGIPNHTARTQALSEIVISEEEHRLYENVLVSLLDNYQLQQASLGDPVANEWRFTVDLEGVVVVGDIDKVVKRNDGYHLIDLKTNYLTDANREQLINYYKPQLYLYKLAYEEKTNILVKTMKLFFLRDKENGIIEIPYEENYEKHLRKQLIELTQWNYSHTL